MRGQIADSRGRASADQDRSRALHYDIGGAGTDAHIANSGCRHARNNNGRAASRYYGTPHMRYHPGHHWAGMHIRDSRGRRHTASSRVAVEPNDLVLLPRITERFAAVNDCVAVDATVPRWQPDMAKQFQPSRVYALRPFRKGISRSKRSFGNWPAAIAWARFPVAKKPFCHQAAKNNKVYATSEPSNK
jgi:hypothetical protein